MAEYIQRKKAKQDGPLKGTYSSGGRRGGGGRGLRGRQEDIGGSCYLTDSFHVVRLNVCV